MQQLYPVIFPALARHRFGFVDLAEYAEDVIEQDASSPFLDPEFTDRFVKDLHMKLGVDYSWGGYLEDRSGLWHGSYLQPGTAYHYGIDVNVPAGTAVTVKYPCSVAAVIEDDGEEHGWGGTIIFELIEPIEGITHFLYAHLASLFAVSPGDHVEPGDIVGIIAPPEHNGGWYEHLHVQALTRDAWDMSQGDLEAFDGYGPVPQGTEHELFPDPEILL